jgi:6-phosphogluconolactonase
MTARGAIRQFDSVQALTAAAADEFVRRSSSAIMTSGRFTVALSGGNTPKFLFGHLANRQNRERVSWDRVHFFWGDERAVPPNHADSNYGMAHRELLLPIAVPPDNVHRIRAESGADQAADSYERELRQFFGLAAEELPRFDLIFLGLGEDGHTASLFPGTTAVDERNCLVAASWVPNLQANRITLTLPVLNQGRCVVFLIAGEAKAPALQTVLEAPPSPELPASLVDPIGDLFWFIDRSAGRLLRGANR